MSVKLLQNPIEDREKNCLDVTLGDVSCRNLDGLNLSIVDLSVENLGIKNNSLNSTLTLTVPSFLADNEYEFDYTTDSTARIPTISGGLPTNLILNSPPTSISTALETASITITNISGTYTTTLKKELYILRVGNHLLLDFNLIGEVTTFANATTGGNHQLIFVLDGVYDVNLVGDVHPSGTVTAVMSDKNVENPRNYDLTLGINNDLQVTLYYMSAIVASQVKMFISLHLQCA